MSNLKIKSNNSSANKSFRGDWVLFPQHTTAERDNLVNVDIGAIIWNSDLGEYQKWNGTNWDNIGGSVDLKEPRIVSKERVSDQIWGPGGSSNSIVEVVEYQPNRFIAIGNFTSWNGVPNRQKIVMFDENNEMVNWNPAFTTGTVKNILVLDDGSIILAGDSIGLNNKSIIKLNPDGTINTDFDTNTGTTTPGFTGIDTVKKDQNGKIIIGGSFTTWNGNPKGYIIRLNPDGTEDTTFNIGTGFEIFNGHISEILIQSDGKIILIGRFRRFNNAFYPNILRLNPNGSIDPTFTPGMGIINTISNIEVNVKGSLMDNDEILLYGSDVQNYNGNTVYSICKLDKNGILDPNFKPVFKNYNNNIPNIIKVNVIDGKIWVIGSFLAVNDEINIFVSVLEKNGELSNTIKKEFIFNLNDSINGVLETKDGNVLLWGNIKSFRFRDANGIIKINKFGEKIETFKSRLYVNGSVERLFSDPNREWIYPVGFFNLFNGRISNSNVAKINKRGTSDPNFKAFCTNTIKNVVAHPNGNLYIFGAQTYGMPNSGITVLNKEYQIKTDWDELPNIDFNNFSSIFWGDVFSDGSMLVVGTMSNYNNQPVNRIIKIRPNGTLDTNFMTNLGTGPNLTIRLCKILADDSMIICGDFTIWNGNTHNRIIKLQPNGQIDTSFNAGTGITSGGVSKEIKVFEDGIFLISSGAMTYNNVDVGKIVLINHDGTINNTFLTNIIGMFPFHLHNINDIDYDKKEEKYYIVGNFNSWLGNTTIRKIVKLNRNGTVDNTFSCNMSNLPFGIRSILVIDDKIYLGGNNPNDANAIILDNKIRPALFTINKNGSVILYENNESIDFIQNQGLELNVSDYDYLAPKSPITKEILRLQEFENYEKEYEYKLLGLDQGWANIDQNMLKISATQIINEPIDGIIRKSYGIFGNASRFGIDIQSDGKIIIGGNFTLAMGYNVSRICRLNQDLSIDTTFKTINEDLSYVSLGCNGPINVIKVQPDDKILVGGGFSNFLGRVANNIVRLNPDGSLDDTFFLGTGTTGEILTIDLQSDGKIIIGGNISSFNSQAIFRICRLNQNGTLDNTFSIASGVNGSVQSIAVDPTNDKIYAVGLFTAFNLNPRNRICRLNQNGTLDNTFSIGNGFNNIATVVKIQSDGKILVGGNFTQYNGVARNRIVRINTDGSNDATFNIGTGFNGQVQNIDIQSNGGIIVVGNFTSFNSNTRNYLARLNPDGTLDTLYNSSFSVSATLIGVKINPINDDAFISFTSAGNNSYNRTPVSSYFCLNSTGGLVNGDLNRINFKNSDIINAVCEQSDGKLLIGGTSITGYFGQYAFSNNNLIRLNQDGTLDANFMINIGSGANNSINIIKTHETDIYLSGTFSSFNGVNYNRFVKLLEDGNIDLSFSNIGITGNITDFGFQSDGKIIIIGNFVTGFGNNIIRINTDGTFDSSFNSGGTGINGNPKSLIIDKDDYIYVADVNSYNSINTTKIIKLTPNGDLYNDFKFPYKNGIYLKILLKDNYIYAKVDSTIYYPISGLIKINKNTGTPDFSFGNYNQIEISNNNNSIGFSPSSNSSLIIGHDDNIIFVGSFSYNNIPIKRIISINEKGEIVKESNQDIFLVPSVSGIIKRSNGNYIVWYSEQNYMNQPYSKICEVYYGFSPNKKIIRYKIDFNQKIMQYDIDLGQYFTQNSLITKNYVDQTGQRNLVPVPTTSTSPGTPGQFSYDSTYIYFCIGTDQWVRTPIDLTVW